MNPAAAPVDPAAAPVDPAAAAYLALIDDHRAEFDAATIVPSRDVGGLRAALVAPADEAVDYSSVPSVRMYNASNALQSLIMSYGYSRHMFPPGLIEEYCRVLSALVPGAAAGSAAGETLLQRALRVLTAVPE